LIGQDAAWKKWKALAASTFWCTLARFWVILIRAFRAPLPTQPRSKRHVALGSMGVAVTIAAVVLSKRDAAHAMNHHRARRRVNLAA
jgi:hypothetical protein